MNLAGFAEYVQLKSKYLFRKWLFTVFKWRIKNNQRRREREILVCCFNQQMAAPAMDGPGAPSTPPSWLAGVSTSEPSSVVRAPALFLQSWDTAACLLSLMQTGRTAPGLPKKWFDGPSRESVPLSYSPLMCLNWGVVYLISPRSVPSMGKYFLVEVTFVW